MLLANIFPSAGKADRRTDINPFELSAFYAYDDKGNIYLDLGISIGYNRLVFFKQTNGYKAEYRVYIQLFDRKSGRLIRGDVWEKYVTSADYGETRSSSSISSIQRRIYLQPGNYKVEGKIEVIDTNIEYKRETIIEIPGRAGGLPNISKPVFSIPKWDREGEKPPLGEIEVSICTSLVTSGFTVCPDGIYADFNMWLRASFNLSIPSPDDKRGNCFVSVKISDSEKMIISYNRQRVLLDETGHSIFCLDFNVDDYRIGVYRMEISAEIEGTEKMDVTRKEFAVLFNKGSLYEHFEETKELISLVASEEELKPLLTVPPESRIDEWNIFWSDRESARGSGYYNFELFLSNMAYALKHFSDGMPGWKADMGRIYIRNGKPDKVVTKQGGRLGVYYQFWYYYSKGIIYVFTDKFGTGDYRYTGTRHF